jgi:hypothetical protein
VSYVATGASLKDMLNDAKHYAEGVIADINTVRAGALKVTANAAKVAANAPAVVAEIKQTAAQTDLTMKYLRWVLIGGSAIAVYFLFIRRRSR